MTNANLPALPGLPVPLASTPSEKGLVTLLKNSDDAAAAARRVAQVPAMREELERSGTALVRAAYPATDEEIQEEVMILMAAYGVSKKEVLEHASALLVWGEALAGLPLDAIRVGRVEASRTCTFLPKPADVYKAAKAYATELQVVAYRAKAAMEALNHREPKVKPDERMSHEEMKAAGYMDAQGRVILGRPKPIATTTPTRPRESRHEMAARLRLQAQQRNTP